MVKKKTKRRKVRVSLRSKEWQKLVDELKEEADYTCQECGSTNRSLLQGHHRVSFSSRPDLELDPLNVEILCVYCHSKYHPELKNFILAKQRKKNKKINSILKALNRK